MSSPNEPESSNQKFEWETRFYQCLSSPHMELADRTCQAENILCERMCRIEAGALSAAEREAFDEALQHLRKIQVQNLGYPQIDGEFKSDNFSSQNRNYSGDSSANLTGRPIPLSERRRLWKTHVA